MLIFFSRKIKGISNNDTLCRKRENLPESSGNLQPGDVIVRFDPRYFRPTEVESLLGDPAKFKNKLGWEPRISFTDLMKEMVCPGLEEAQRDALCRNEGFKVFDYNE